MRALVHSLRGVVVVATFIAAASTIAGCTQHPASPGQIAKILGPTWKEALSPDGKLTPGSIVVLIPAGDNEVDVKWLGTLADCDVPSDKLVITPGAFPAMIGTFAVSASLKAKLLQALNVTADASHEATFHINNASDDSLDYTKFTRWFGANVASFPKECTDLLSRPGVYVIQEAFVVTNGSFNSGDQGGVQVQISAPTLPTVPKTATSAISALAARKISAAALLSTAAGGTTNPAAAQPSGATKAGPSAAGTSAASSTSPAVSSSGQPDTSPCTPAQASASGVTLGGHVQYATCITVSNPITFALRSMQDVGGSWTGAMYSAGGPPPVDPLRGKVIRTVQEVFVPR